MACDALYLEAGVAVPSSARGCRSFSQRVRAEAMAASSRSPGRLHLYGDVGVLPQQARQGSESSRYIKLLLPPPSTRSVRKVLALWEQRSSGESADCAQSLRERTS